MHVCRVPVVCRNMAEIRGKCLGMWQRYGRDYDSVYGRGVLYSTGAAFLVGSPSIVHSLGVSLCPPCVRYLHALGSSPNSLLREVADVCQLGARVVRPVFVRL